MDNEDEQIRESRKPPTGLMGEAGWAVVCGDMI